MDKIRELQIDNDALRKEVEYWKGEYEAANQEANKWCQKAVDRKRTIDKLEYDILKMNEEVKEAVAVADRYIDERIELDKKIEELKGFVDVNNKTIQKLYKEIDYYEDKFNEQPKPVTRKVKKEVTKYINLYRNNLYGTYAAETIHDSEAEAKRMIDKDTTVETYLKTISFTTIEEVEEVVEPVLVERWVNLYNDGIHYTHYTEKEALDYYKSGNSYGYIATFKMSGYYYPKG